MLAYWQLDAFRNELRWHLIKIWQLRTFTLSPGVLNANIFYAQLIDKAEYLNILRATKRRNRHRDTLKWRHNNRDGVSNQRRYDCLLNHLFRHRSNKTLKLRVTGHYAGNSLVTGEFPAQRASNAENISIWWRHHEIVPLYYFKQSYHHKKLTIEIVDIYHAIYMNATQYLRGII